MSMPTKIRRLGLLSCGLLGLLLGCATTPELPPVTSAQFRQRQALAIKQFEQKRDAAQYQAALARWERDDTAACEELLHQLLTRNPAHRDANLLMAELALLEQQPEKGLPYAQRVGRDHPQDAQASHITGLLLDAMGRGSEAVAHYERAVTFAPDDEIYKASLDLAMSPARGDLQASREDKLPAPTAGPAPAASTVRMVGHEPSGEGPSSDVGRAYRHSIAGALRLFDQDEQELLVAPAPGAADSAPSDTNSDAGPQGPHLRFRP